MRSQLRKSALKKYLKRLYFGKYCTKRFSENKYAWEIKK